jgi:hypothetical protein
LKQGKDSPQARGRSLQPVFGPAVDWPLQADDPLVKCVVLRGSVGPINHDGVWLMTVDEDRLVRLWDLKGDDPSLKGLDEGRESPSARIGRSRADGIRGLFAFSSVIGGARVPAAFGRSAS